MKTNTRCSPSHLPLVNTPLAPNQQVKLPRQCIPRRPLVTKVKQDVSVDPFLFTLFSGAHHGSDWKRKKLCPVVCAVFCRRWSQDRWWRVGGRGGFVAIAIVLGRRRGRSDLREGLERESGACSRRNGGNDWWLRGGWEWEDGDVVLQVEATFHGWFGGVNGSLSRAGGNPFPPWDLTRRVFRCRGGGLLQDHGRPGGGDSGETRCGVGLDVMTIRWRWWRRRWWREGWPVGTFFGAEMVRNLFRVSASLLSSDFSLSGESIHSIRISKTRENPSSSPNSDLDEKLNSPDLRKIMVGEVEPFQSAHHPPPHHHHHRGKYQPQKPLNNCEIRAEQGYSIWTFRPSLNEPKNLCQVGAVFFWGTAEPRTHAPLTFLPSLLASCFPFPCMPGHVKEGPVGNSSNQGLRVIILLDHPLVHVPFRKHAFFQVHLTTFGSAKFFLGSCNPFIFHKGVTWSARWESPVCIRLDFCINM